jgi:hypothetical protein
MMGLCEFEKRGVYSRQNRGTIILILPYDKLILTNRTRMKLTPNLRYGLTYI